MSKLPVIIAGAIMVASFIGMIVCAKKQQTNEAAKPIAVGLMIVVMICAIVILWQTGIFGDTSVKGFIKNEMVYNRSVGTVVGRYLAEKFPGSKALVVVDKVKNSVFDEQYSALKDAIKGKITIVAEDMPTPVEPPPAPEGEAATSDAEGKAATGEKPALYSEEGIPPQEISLRETMKAADFDALIQRHPDCNLIITFIGLPAEVEEMEFWHSEAKSEEKPDLPEKPKIAIINGDVYKLKNAISTGMVVAAVTYSPKAKFDEATAPSNPKTAFDKRYLLITPENVESINEEFGGLFQKE